MTLALTGAVELLDRSLAYTRGALALVTPDRYGDPTPCAHWDLATLLRHMDDGLDAFTEAATGSVALAPSDGPTPFETLAEMWVEEGAQRPPRDLASPAPRPDAIRAKACALLGWWCEHPPPDVHVGDAPMPSALLVGIAALEITVHGWDVHQALGTGHDVPPELAAELLPVAVLTVGDADRPARFAARRAVPDDAPAAQRLLAHLGRG